MRWVKCIELEGQKGILRPYVANIAMNLWGCDLLEQRSTQINIPSILETNYRLMYVSGKNIRRFIKNSHQPFRLYKNRAQQLLIFQKHQDLKVLHLNG